MSVAIGWGILGTGYAARQFAKGLCFVPGARVAAVGSRALATAQAFARPLQIPRAYGSYEELVRDGDVDVVYVATPQSSHGENCLLALEAGKAVLCEKPFTLDARQAQEVIQQARRRRLFCMEAMWMRFIPLFQKALALVDGGAIGGVKTVTADFSLPEAFDANDRLFSRELGGGALLDRGVYGLSLAYRVLGPPSSVVARSSIGDTGVDEQCVVLLGYPQGRLAILSSGLRAYGSNQAVIMGDGGRLTIHEPFYRPHRLSIREFARFESDSPERAGLLGRIRHRASEIPRLQRLYRCLSGLIGSRQIVQTFDGNGYNYEAAEVVRCLRSGELESDVMPLDETLCIMKTVDAIREQWNLEPAEN